MKKLSKKLLSVLLIVAMLIPTGAMTVSTSAADVSIPDDAVEFNGHYYKVYNERSVTTYAQAKTFCKNLGGYLATISSAEENTFLYAYIKSVGFLSAYFGFTDEDKDGKWEWVNGETSDYSNWANGEPGNYRIYDECFAMFYFKFKNGQWNSGDFGYKTDASDGTPRAFICEWDSEGDLSGEYYISGIVTGVSNVAKIAIDGVWYEYDISVPGLKDAIERFPLGGTINCKIKSGKIVACSKTEIKNGLTLSINTLNNSIQYDATTKKYNTEKISFNINATNNVTSLISGTINTAYVAGYDITFDKLQISCYNGNMLYFKDGWFGLGKTKEIEKKFESPVTLKAGETFNFSEDLTAYITDDCEWGDELKKEAEIHVCAYNGETQVAWNVLRVTFKNQTAESSVKNNAELNKKIQNAANLLEKTTGVIHSPYLEELLTKDGLKEATNALKCKVALSSAILKAKKNETIEDKLIDKLMKKAGISKEWIGAVYTTDIIHSVYANTKEYGKFEVEFNIKLTNISIGNGNPYAGFSFETTYKIKGGKNIKERTGSVTSYFGYADIQTFANSIEEVALEQIEYAYNLGYGDDLNEVCEMFFDDTITSILSKTKAESYSHLFYESMTYPSKQINVHCPVDIFIYDSEGTLCASVENNEITMTCDDIDIEVVGDEKYLTIYDGDYSIEIIATANDDMDIEIEEYSSKDRLLRTTTFNNIALAPGDSFKTDIDENYIDNEYQITKNKEDIISADSDKGYIHYVDAVEIIDKKATCIEDGEYHIECAECKETVLTETIPATGHNDTDHNGICDNCGKDFTVDCGHSCHSDNAFVQFFYKIARFFWKLFGMQNNRFCACGKAHW